MKPSIGRIVLYSLSAVESAINWQRECAAIITSVHSDRVVNLTVFTDATWGEPAESIKRITSVELSKSGAPEDGTWRWPPRE